jgi:hypothetical protein
VARLEIDRSQHAQDGSAQPDVKVKRGDTLFLVQLYNLTDVAARETNTLQIAVPDVRATYLALRDAAAKATGRILVAQFSEQDLQNAGAQIDVEVRRADEVKYRAALDAAGEVISRQVTRAPEGDATTDSKVQFRATLLGLDRLAPRDTTTIQVAVPDVRTAYQALRDAAGKASARVLVAQLNEQDPQHVTAQIDVEVRRANEAAFRTALDTVGEVMSRQVTRAAEANNATDSKVHFRANVLGFDGLVARDTTTVEVAVPDVRTAYQALREAAGKAAGRVLVAQLNEQDPRHVTAQIEVELRRADETAFRTALDTVGEIVSRQMTRAAEANNATDSKVKYQVGISGVNRLKPRETTGLTLEVTDVDQALAAFAGQVAEAKGRQLSAQSTRESTGKVTAQASYEVPQASAGLADRFKAAGKVRGYQSTKDPQAPAGKYATVRIDVTLVSGDQIVSEGDGLWPQIRRGLTISMAVLLTSVTWVIFGLCVVLPWGVVIYGFYRLLRRRVVSRPAVSQS